MDGPLTGIKGGEPTTGVGLQAEAEGIIGAATSIETDWEIGPLESVHVLNVPGLISEGETVTRGSGKACSFLYRFGLPPFLPLPRGSPCIPTAVILGVIPAFEYQ